MRASVLGLLLLLLTPVAGYSADAPARPISLAEAIAIALRHNRTLAAAGYSTRAARDQVGVARGFMLPRLDALENYSYTDSPVMVFSSLLSQQEFGPSDFLLSHLNHPGFLSNFQSQARLSFPLFAGGRLIAAYRAAGFGADAEQWQEVQVRQQVEFAVIQTYYSALLARQRTAVIDRALAAARAHLKQAQDLFAHGVVVNSDVLRTQVLEGTMEQQRIEADSEAAISCARLAHVLGQEDQSFAPMDHAASPQTAGAAPVALEKLVDAALGARPEIKIADDRVRQAGEAVTIARADYLPTIGIAGVYENDSERLIRGGNNEALLVSGKLNLFEGLATASKVDSAQAELLRARTLASDARHAVALEVESARRRLIAAAEGLLVAEHDIQYAENSLRTLEDRYASGLATNVAVLDAHTAREEADLGLVSARVAIAVDRAALDLATGAEPYGRSER
jgi:outer membrane protein